MVPTTPNTLSGKLYKYIDKQWYNSRVFFYGKSKATFFSIGFFLLYGLIQLLGLGQIILTTAIGLERIFMQSRYIRSTDTAKRLAKYTEELENTCTQSDNTIRAINHYIATQEKAGKQKVYIKEIYKIISKINSRGDTDD